MNRSFPRHFLMATLLLSLPLSAMQNQANRQMVRIASSYINHFIKKHRLDTERSRELAPTVPVMAMTPTVVVEAAKEPTTISTVFNASTAVGSLAGAGATALIFGLPATPIIAAGVGIAAVITVVNGFSNSSSSSDNKTNFYAQPAPAKTTNFAQEQHYTQATPTYVEIAKSASEPKIVVTTKSNAVITHDINNITEQNYDQVKYVMPLKSMEQMEADIHATKEHVRKRKQAKAEAEARNNAINERKEDKKPSKAKIAERAAKEAAKNGVVTTPGGKKPDDKKERKVNPHSFKQDFKNNPRVKENYKPNKNGNLRLKDGGKPLTDAAGHEIYEIKADFKHCDLEAIAKDNTHLGSIDPITLEVYKPPVLERKFSLIGWFFAGSAASRSANAEAYFASRNALTQANAIDAPVDSLSNTTATTTDTSFVPDTIDSYSTATTTTSAVPHTRVLNTTTNLSTIHTPTNTDENKQEASSLSNTTSTVYGGGYAKPASNSNASVYNPTPPPPPTAHNSVYPTIPSSSQDRETKGGITKPKYTNQCTVEKANELTNNLGVKTTSPTATPTLQSTTKSAVTSLEQRVQADAAQRAKLQAAHDYREMQRKAAESYKPLPCVPKPRQTLSEWMEYFSKE